MSKAKRHSIRCMNCDWRLINTHKHTDGWKCPICKGPIAPWKGCDLIGKNIEGNRKRIKPY